MDPADPEDPEDPVGKLDPVGQADRLAQAVPVDSPVLAVRVDLRAE